MKKKALQLGDTQKFKFELGEDEDVKSSDLEEAKKIFMADLQRIFAQLK
jgi:hypothetical protein